MTFKIPKKNFICQLFGVIRGRIAQISLTLKTTKNSIIYREYKEKSSFQNEIGILII